MKEVKTRCPWEYQSECITMQQGFLTWLSGGQEGFIPNIYRYGLKTKTGGLSSYALGLFMITDTEFFSSQGNFPYYVI